MRFAVSAALPVPFAIALLLVAAPQTARAQVTGYNDLTSFNASATTSAVYDFEGIAPAGSNAVSPSLAPLTVTIVGGNNIDYFVDSATFIYGTFSLNGTDSLAGAINDSSTPSSYKTTLGLGGSYTAFGTEFGFRADNSSNGNPDPFPTGTVSVQLFNGATAVGNAFSSAVPATGTFIGLTSTQSFDRATFTSTAQSGVAYQQFDNVRVGSIGVAAAGAPEPGTLPLFGMGLVTGAGAVGTVRRRRNATKRAA